MNYLSEVKMATQNLEDKIIDYQDWAEIVLGADYKDVYSDEYIRRASRVFSVFLKNAELREISESDDDKAEELKSLLDEIKSEKIKLQTANLEYSAIQRAEARNDLFNEQLIAAIGRLEPIDCEPPVNICVPEQLKNTALLVISDLHAGSEFTIHGMYNEVVNSYSFDIMKARLYELVNKLYKDDIVFDDLTVAFCGDMIEGILRESSLLKLREPVIDTVIRLGEFLSNWLVHLSDMLNTKINVVTVGGNHDIMRSLTQRPSFEGENFTKIIVEFMKLRLIDYDWIKIDDYQDVAIKTIRGTNVMFHHGDDKNLKTTMDYFENLYNIDVDEIIAGHKHSPESKSVGITELGDKTLTRVGSIVGVDTFAKSIRVSARPSAYIAMYTDNGKTWSRNYYL